MVNGVKLPIVWICLGLMVSCCNNTGNETNEFKGSSWEKSARLSLESEFIDVGHHHSGDELIRSIRFKNSGTDDLIIKRVMGVGQGIQVDFPKNPVKPGEGGIITIQIRTAGRIGTEERRIVILSNDMITPRQSVTVSMILDMDLGIRPRNVWFGDFKGSTPVKREFDIIGTRINEIDLKSLLIDAGIRSELLSFTIHDRRNAEPPSISVEVQLDPAHLQPGTFKIPIFAETKLSNTPILDVILTGSLLGSFEITPARVYFGQFVEGEVMHRTVTLSRYDGKAFRITGVRSNEACFSIDSVPGETASSHNLTIIFTPGKTSEMRFNSNVIVETDAQDGQQIDIPLYAFRKIVRSK
ncbi:DUF1573 domain-containing protein [bacterium]|nr:DUF1573 domain-containing protein [candidate division CSSED10-310 bacterium]